MKLGIESYSYHRYFGEVYPTEADPGVTWTLANFAEHMQDLPLEAVSLETCFLPKQDSQIVPCIQTLNCPVMFAWGHPNGLMGVPETTALAEISRFLRLSALLGCEVLRIVVSSSDRFKDPHGPQVDLAMDRIAKLLPLAEELEVQILSDAPDDAGPSFVSIDPAPRRAPERPFTLPAVGPAQRSDPAPSSRSLRSAEEALEAELLQTARARLDRDLTAQRNAATEPVLDAETRATTLRLRAERQLADNHLMVPPGDNAFETYQALGAIVGEDAPEVRAGLEKIRNLYVRQAEEKLAAGRVDRASDLVGRALIAVPKDPAALALSKRIEQARGR